MPLTAVGLARQDDKFDLLARAAGEEYFVNDRSDLLTGIGSELFQMCLHVLEPQSVLRNTMKQQVLEYAKSFGGVFSRDWVVEAADIPELAATIEPDVAGGIALLKAVEACSAESDIRHIGILYARVIRLLWPKLKVRDERSLQQVS